MSLILYGCVNLVDSSPQTRAAVLGFWGRVRNFAAIGIWHESPYLDSLSDDIARLFSTSSSLPFLVTGEGGKTNDPKQTSDSFFYEAGKCYWSLMDRYHEALDPTAAWTRIPQFLGLFVMVFHEAVKTAYFVVEDWSGDCASTSDLVEIPHVDAIGHIFKNYCITGTNEDPFICRCNLSIGP